MKTKKKFDAVGFMRKQRDRISRDTAGMTAEQLMKYHQKQSEWWKPKLPVSSIPTGRKRQTA